MNKDEKFVITLNRELGSGGRTVGRKLAEKLGVKYYDKALIEGLTKEFGLSMEEIEKIKAQKKSWWDEFNYYYMKRGDVIQPMESETILTTDSLFAAETSILKGLAKQESCVVAGRSGFMVFREWPNHLDILIQAPLEKRIERVMAKQQLSREEAIATIEKVDKGRETFIRQHADTSRYDARNYDLVINMNGLTEDDAVEMVLDYIERSGKNS